MTTTYTSVAPKAVRCTTCGIEMADYVEGNVKQCAKCDFAEQREQEAWSFRADCIDAETR